MVRELEVIFGLNTVAGKLRIARHALVLFQKLRRVAALAVVLTVSTALLSAEVRSPLPSTAATAAALSIVDQNPTSLTRSFPFRLGRQACAQRRKGLTLSFRTAPSGRYRSGDCVGGGAEAPGSFIKERPRSCPKM